MNDKKPIDVSAVWYEWFATDAFAVDKGLRRVLRVIPQDPRCRFCGAPFSGVGGAISRTFLGKRQSLLNPNYCDLCESYSRQHPGGTEVPMAMLFADVRNSTALSETMSPTEFSQVINRFYRRATRIVTEADGLVDKLAGDSIAAFWGQGFAGRAYVRRAIDAAVRLAKAMVAERIPVGVGVHSGVAYFGAMGSADRMTAITAIGDEVNMAARLASQAAAGEVIVSENALREAAVQFASMEARLLELKGISEPVSVRVMKLDPA